MRTSNDTPLDRSCEREAPIHLGLLWDLDDLRGAADAYRQGVRWDDAYSAFHLHLLLRDHGDFDGARQALEVAREIGDTTHPDAEATLRECAGPTEPTP